MTVAALAALELEYQMALEMSNLSPHNSRYGARAQALLDVMLNIGRGVPLMDLDATFSRISKELLDTVDTIKDPVVQQAMLGQSEGFAEGCSYLKQVILSHVLEYRVWRAPTIGLA